MTSLNCSFSQQFAKEKEEMEKEKWEIITKAKDAIERAMFFKAELDVKEENIRELETQLKEVSGREIAQGSKWKRDG